MSLARLAEAAEGQSLRTSLLRTDLASLSRWRLPAILHVNKSHYIGFVGRSDDGRLFLFDNSIGLIDCTEEWFSRRYKWEGEALVFGDVPGYWQEVVSGYWGWVAGLLALILFGMAVWPARPGRATLEGSS